MLHDRRPFRISPVATAAELAQKLTQTTWCTCQGFRLNDWLFLNDSFGAGAQEYAIVRDGYQYESVTFSWMTEAQALEWIEDWLARSSPPEHFKSKVTLVAHPEGPCSRCA